MDRQQAAIAVVTWPRRLVGCAGCQAHASRAVTFASIGGFCRTPNLKGPRPTAHHRLPAIFGLRAVTAEGGLMSYGVDLIELFRQSAIYADRILKGEKPADLPVQLPTKFELVVNLRTAKTLSLEVPPSLLATADDAIE